MKVDIDALDDDGWTPLHAAIYWRNMDAAELLVSHGADINKTTKAVSRIVTDLKKRRSVCVCVCVFNSQSLKRPSDASFSHYEKKFFFLLVMSV